MRAPRFKHLFAHLPAVNVLQRLRALAARHPDAGIGAMLRFIDDAGGEGRCCPGCGCPRYHRHGHSNGLQRYRCCACRRTYNDLSGTPLARLRMREKWLDYLAAEYAFKSLRAAAREVGVHRDTALRWRHRFRVRPPKGRGGEASATDLPGSH